MDVCQSLPAGAGFVSSITSYIDCQAQLLGSNSYQALSAPGSTLSVVLTGFLTIFIALIGYNLLLGRTLTVRDGTLAFVKIGAVLALATSWPAYRTLVYDLVVDGPAQIVADVGRPAGVIGSDGTLLERLDLSDQALAQLAILGPGNAIAPQAQTPPPPFAGFDSFALGGSRILFLLTTLASFGALRVVTGLMLALGPFFIAFFMFESTRSLFEGWVRVLGGTALAMIGVSIALGMELALLEPWLSGALARRMAGEALPTVPTELFVIVTLFSIIVVAALFASARIAQAFRLPAVFRFDRELGVSRQNAVQVGRSSGANQRNEIERSRAAAIAGFAVSLSRRDGLELNHPSSASAGPARLMPGLSSPTRSDRSSPSVGRSFRRQTRMRGSASAKKRDSIA